MKKETKNKIVIVLFWIMIILFIAIVYMSVNIYAEKRQRKVDHPIAENQMEAQDPNLLSNKDNEYFELQGFGQLQIDNNNRNINLINPKDNKVYLEYKVTNGETVLFETELINPGNMVQYDVFSCLDAGEHTLTYIINVYDIETLDTLWSGIKQEQNVFIKE